MSLTRQQLLDKAQPRFEWVEVDGFGKVGIQSLTPVQRAHREMQCYDQVTGQLDDSQTALSDVRMIIDQVCEAPDKAMFAEDDEDELAQLDAGRLRPLLDAILKFNGPDAAKNGSAA